MNLFIVSIVCAFLQVSCKNPRSHWTLLPNILVVEVDGTEGQQPLRCLEQPEDHLTGGGSHSGDIFWQKDGAEEEQRGNSYLVRLVESQGGGNYTCHSSDGTLLNHTEVLIRHDKTTRKRILEKNEQGEYLSCSTQNYNGEFHCSWRWHSKRVGTVAFIETQRVSDENMTLCSVDPSARHWRCSSSKTAFHCSVDDSGSAISCRDERHCPYAEEREQIYITVYLRTNQFLLESYSKLFYLSDIVKPDKVRIKVNNTHIKWDYPTSWSTPHSYFPLTFQIYQLKGRSAKCKGCENPCNHLIISAAPRSNSTVCWSKLQHRAKVVCARAKDALCNSQWSEWTHFRLPTQRKR